MSELAAAALGTSWNPHLLKRKQNNSATYILYEALVSEDVFAWTK